MEPAIRSGSRSHAARGYRLLSRLLLTMSVFVASGDGWKTVAAEPPPRSLSMDGSPHFYVPPSVSLWDQDGKKVLLPTVLNDGRPLLVNFVFTSCTAICPMLGHLLGEVSRRLGTHADAVHLVSISIDPEHDSPDRLRDYAQHLGAGPNWTFYTSTLGDSIKIQKAFGVYRGDKMNHLPVILVRSRPDGGWIRLEGFTSPARLLEVLSHG
jgi:cytochrome oxidase Cu insertion factor (SCO1/SenC/PrrC family)